MARLKTSMGKQARDLVNKFSAIGESKKARREEINTPSLESAHLISDKIHSYKSLENTRNDLANLGKFARKEFGISTLQELNIQMITAWIEQKTIGYATASNYLSNINKVSSVLSVSPKEIASLRKTLSQTLPKPKRPPRAYDLTRVKVPGKSGIAYELQKQYGLRPGAATHINLDRQLHGNTLSFQQKGGKWSEIELTGTLASQIRENAVNGKFSIISQTYARHFREALEKTGQKSNGPHGIRHTYAQRRLAEGASLEQVANEMGHTREEITRIYAR